MLGVIHENFIVQKPPCHVQKMTVKVLIICACGARWCLIGKKDVKHLWKPNVYLITQSDQCFAEMDHGFFNVLFVLSAPMPGLYLGCGAA